MSLWKIGEENALSILMNYMDEKIYSYSTDRNDPIIDGTSRLSPYLSMGIISSKRCILEALKKNNFELDSGEKGIIKWIDEIVWREFYRNIMFSFPKVSKGMPFQDYTKNIKWRFNEEEFDDMEKWKDWISYYYSAMRQL
jgi:Deoxyribodipyrimidine photolyase